MRNMKALKWLLAVILLVVWRPGLEGRPLGGARRGEEDRVKEAAGVTAVEPRENPDGVETVSPGANTADTTVRRKSRYSRPEEAGQELEGHPDEYPSGKEAKEGCEAAHRCTCVCSVENVLEKMQSALKRGLYPDALQRALNRVVCKRYHPLGEGFLLGREARAPVWRRPRPEYTPDPGPGPKIFPYDSLLNMLFRVFPDEGLEIKVFQGSDVEVPCIPKEKLRYFPSEADLVSLDWVYDSRKLVRGGRVLEDYDLSGMLRIVGIEYSDSGVYDCRVRYKDVQAEETTTVVFSHRIDVVELPKLLVKGGVRYDTNAGCSEEGTRLFTELVAPAVQSRICPRFPGMGRCSVEAFRPACIPQRQRCKQNVDLKKIWIPEDWNRTTAQIINDFCKRDKKSKRTEITVQWQMEVGPRLYVPPRYLSDRLEGRPDSLLRLDVKALLELRHSFIEALSLPVKMANGYQLIPDIYWSNMKTVIGCKAGFYLQEEGFCVPCGRDSYSLDGDVACSPCPGGEYQDSTGSTFCHRCPHVFYRDACFYWSGGVILTAALLCLFVAALCIKILGCFFSRGEVPLWDLPEPGVAPKMKIKYL